LNVSVFSDISKNPIKLDLVLFLWGLKFLLC
jgi:hypothetical protein